MSLLRRRKQEAVAAGIDPSTIQGRKAEDARAELEKKVGPTATKFVAIMLDILEKKGGIHDEEQRKRCGADLTGILRKDLRELVTGGPGQDRILISMAEVLRSYGVRDETTQEDIILDFLITLKDLGEVKLP
jgi:hypothetical protein